MACRCRSALVSGRHPNRNGRSRNRTTKHLKKWKKEMRILFVHMNFPAQFRSLASFLGRDSRNEVVFASMNETPGWDIPGVRKALFVPDATVFPEGHGINAKFWATSCKASGALKLAVELRRQGFVPDIICGHSGWGPTMYLCDAFPEAAFVGYFEWFCDTESADMCFSGKPLSQGSLMEVRCNNIPIPMDLAGCSHELCPMRWQSEQLPPEFRPKKSVISDGVNTEYFSPEPMSRMAPICPLPTIGSCRSRFEDQKTEYSRHNFVSIQA